ncbi:MAG: cysteine desulfurase family protein (TIGR01976 family) [Pirellulaceae bacterium]|jgi:cysteine desulfurase family protein (TIGR01976 family)
MTLNNQQGLTKEQVAACRAQFPALTKTVNGHQAAFFDGPAGTQVPQMVIDAIADYLIRCNANHEGVFTTSRESDALLHDAHRAVADFLGVDDPDTIAFGPNMTTLTFGLSRALARTWNPGDEIVVTRMDHDANFTPWVSAAEDAGATVRIVEFCHEDCTLNLDDFESKINDKTRLVAVGSASNASGSVNPVKQIVQWAHQHNAQVFVDAVHLAPHRLLDVKEYGCDFLACSAYKFFGPHIGILWGRRELLEELSAYKLRPAADDLPGKWMTGTQNHECIAGTMAGVNYLADLGRRVTGNAELGRRAALQASMSAIGQYENQLALQLLDALAEMPAVKVWGITDPSQLDQRVPTFSITHDRIAPEPLAKLLDEHGIFVWNGNYYALNFSTALGHEPQGMVRIGFVHYNTTEEVQRLIDVLRSC